MSDNKMFKELTFYVEACESGSMFPNLTDKESIYAVTASNATQSSYATYCGSDASLMASQSTLAWEISSP